MRGFEPGIAKLEQTLIAVLALDALVPRDVQLALFVNTVYLLAGAYRPTGLMDLYYGEEAELE